MRPFPYFCRNMRGRKKKTPKRKARSDTSAKAKKVYKRKTGRRGAPKVRNSGTLSEQAFWNMIRQLLRRRTIFWLPIVETRNATRIPYKGPNKRRKYSYVCENCKKAFAGNQVNVHHVIEAGSLTCAEDLPGFVTRLFCERDNLKLLCHTCHDKEHEKDKIEDNISI